MTPQDLVEPPDQPSVFPAQLAAAAVPLPPSTRPASPTSDSSFDQQLAQARSALAQKVKRQQQHDGVDLDDEAGGEESGERTAGDDAEGGGTLRQRRGSAVSVASEDEDDVVERLLRPGKPRTAAPVVETMREEPTPASDPRTCRICFDGPDELEPTNRLLSPCKCRGSARFVHSQCLESWRKVSQNSKSFYACDVCGYKYRFRRTAVAQIVTSKLTVTLLTAWAFAALVFIAGFFANTLISLVDSRQAIVGGNFLSELFVADHILLGEGVRETVSFVSQQLEGSRFITGSSKSEEDLKKDEEESLGTTFYRYVNPSSKRARRKDAPQDAPLLLRAIMHFVKGSSLIGILSVFYTYVAATFVSPLGRGLFRALRPGGGRRRQDTGASMSQIVIVAIVVVGIVKSIRQVYRGVRWGTKQILNRVEDLVLDVNS